MSADGKYEPSREQWRRAVDARASPTTSATPNATILLAERADLKE